MKVVSYPSTIRSLMHTLVCTRLDVAHTITSVSWFLSNARKEDWIAIKWIARHLRDTKRPVHVLVQATRTCVERC